MPCPSPGLHVARTVAPAAREKTPKQRLPPQSPRTRPSRRWPMTNRMTLITETPGPGSTGTTTGQKPVPMTSTAPPRASMSRAADAKRYLHACRTSRPIRFGVWWTYDRETRCSAHLWQYITRFRMRLIRRNLVLRAERAEYARIFTEQFFSPFVLVHCVSSLFISSGFYKVIRSKYVIEANKSIAF